MIENIHLAFTSLLANKMRALLTMLGIVIGISSVIAIVTIGDSLTGSLNAEMSGMGARNITVEVQSKDMPGVPSMDEQGNYDYTYEYTEPTEADYLTQAMLEDYRRTFSDTLDVLAVSENIGSAQPTNGRYKASVSLYAVNEEYAELEKLRLVAGRFLRSTDMKEKRATAVVSDYFVKRFFGGKKTEEQALGQSLSVDLNGKELRLYIVGVYHYEKPDGGYGSVKGGDTETQLYVPISTAKQLMQSAAGYRSITVRSHPTVDNAAFLRNTAAFFSSYYTRNQKATTFASSMESMMKSAQKMLDSVKLGISAVAAISLLVGGIGVMNIMMVSVTERTREIGIRMALGAKSSSIRTQFIVEAVTICLIGGFIGVVLGVILGSIGAGLMNYTARPSLITILFAVGFSMAIGVFFGYYPANKAAKLDPIEALRYE